MHAWGGYFHHFNYGTLIAYSFKTIGENVAVVLCIFMHTFYHNVDNEHMQ